METLITQIASELGTKWVQLYSRLGLGYRDRYRFVTDHKDESKEERERNCARDTIRTWREGMGELPEREAMTLLLSAFRGVKGFKERAEQLAESLGITLDTPTPPHTTPPKSTSDTDSIIQGPDHNLSQHTSLQNTSAPDVLTKGSLTKPILRTPPKSTPHTLPQHTTLTLPQGTTHTLPQGTPHSSQAGSNNPSEASSDAESNTHTASPQPSYSSGQSQSSGVQSHHHHMLDSPIDLRETIQKYAILDVAQRLPASKLRELAGKLDIPQHIVSDIHHKHLRVEEVYYQLLKCWLERQEDEATFGRLREVLGECQQPAVSAVMLRRLDKGLLLKHTS